MARCDAHTHLGAIDPAADRSLCCATRPADWPALAALATADPRITPAYGLHPWYAAEAEGNWLAELENYLKAGPCCAGEMGLDLARPAPGQAEVFRAQLELARKYDRPAVIHCVRAWGKLLEILRAVRPGRFLLHAYGGSPELVKELAALGAYFSFGSELLTRPGSRAAHDTVPPDRLLYESDGRPGPHDYHSSGDMLLNYLRFIGDQA